MGLIEISNGKYDCAIVMPSKNDILGNGIEKKKCGDYRSVNKKTKLDCCPIPIPDELLDAVGITQIFSTIDLRFGYH